MSRKNSHKKISRAKNSWSQKFKPKIPSARIYPEKFPRTKIPTKIPSARIPPLKKFLEQKIPTKKIFEAEIPPEKIPRGKNFQEKIPEGYKKKFAFWKNWSHKRP